MKLTSSQPLARFRVYPERRTLYYEVYIWRTFKELRGEARARSIPAFNRVDAFVHAYPRYRILPAQRVLPVCGEIHLSSRDLSAEVVAHECTHAALAWAERMGFLLDVARRLPDPRNEGLGGVAEERLCTAQGRMTQQIADRLWAQRLINRKE